MNYWFHYELKDNRTIEILGELLSGRVNCSMALHVSHSKIRFTHFDCSACAFPLLSEILGEFSFVLKSCSFYLSCLDVWYFKTFHNANTNARINSRNKRFSKVRFFFLVKCYMSGIYSHDKETWKYIIHVCEIRRHKAVTIFNMFSACVLFALRFTFIRQ